MNEKRRKRIIVADEMQILPMIHENLVYARNTLSRNFIRLCHSLSLLSHSFYEIAVRLVYEIVDLSNDAKVGTLFGDDDSELTTRIKV